MLPFNGVKMPRWMAGREVLESSYDTVDKSNIVQILDDVLPVFQSNQQQINYLYWYRRGDQPIRKRKKKVRSDIKNVIIENHADEIVNFHVGYRFSEPVQYVRDADDEKGESVSKAIGSLTKMLRTEGYDSQTIELADWIFLCGKGFRMALPKAEDDKSGSEIDIGVLDPRFTDIVYSTRFGRKPLMSIQQVLYVNENGVECTRYECYTKKSFFVIEDGNIVSETPTFIDCIPIVEYRANSTLTGAFELALPLLDAINNTTSNRVDGIEQFVQSFLKFVNVDINSEQYDKLKKEGAILVRSQNGLPADVSIVSSELNQEQTQTLQDHLYNMALIVCNMPSRSGQGKSTSDTGSAVMLRDGWSEAESAAKKFDPMFESAERNFIKVILREAGDKIDKNLSVGDIRIKSPRTKYDNLLVKTQALQNLLQSHVNPLRAYETVGLFADAEQVYTDSSELIAEGRQAEKAKAVKDLADALSKLTGVEVSPEYAYAAVGLFDNPSKVAKDSIAFADESFDKEATQMSRMSGADVRTDRQDDTED